jgi:hypothetical protein
MTSEQLCFENEKATIKKAAKLAEFIRHSKYFVVFTGPEVLFVNESVSNHLQTFIKTQEFH